MTSSITRFLTLTFLVLGLSFQVQAQKKKYQAIQGLGYLHTQVTILIDNWELHPLSDIDLDEFQKEYREHFLEEIQHDEEWVEFMLVEDNLLFQFDEHIDAVTEEAIEENIAFYDKVIELIQQPESMEASLEELRNELQEVDARLYDVIYPSLCR